MAHQSTLNRSPLCLEDICAINIFYRLEAHPVQLLALLPYSVRHKIYCSLSPADVLHYRQQSNVFDDIKDDNCLQADVARLKLLAVLFNNIENSNVFFLPAQPLALKCKELELRTKYITTCYSSLQFMPAITGDYTSLLPKRALRYLTFQSNFWNSGCHKAVRIDRGSLRELLEYCNTPTAPR